MSWRFLRAAILVAGCCCLLTAPGCQWFDQLKGPGFSETENQPGLRPTKTGAKPSGMFFDRRSEQLESRLGVNQ